MNTIALLVTVSAWACTLLLPGGTAWRVLQLIVFGLLGSAMTLTGGLQYWWNSSQQPSQASGLLLCCGLLTLASQWRTVWRALLGDALGVDLEQWRDRRRK